ncbi:MAG: SDR family oxidoreductase [Elusimicrobia bacterium]|nr:SDR family oxidoreductase [Elusimicrobiota bacterium]
MTLKGKVVIVSGASRGIGLAIAKTLQREGAKIVITAVNAERLVSVQAELAASGEVLAIPADVTDESAVQAAFMRTLESFGKLDALVNNAGMALAQPVADTTREQWDKVMAVNATGPFLMCREAVRHMKGSKVRGKIVNVASVAGVSGSSMAAAYSASKAALIGFSKALAKEVARHGINVNCVCPGAADTDMFHKDTIGVLAAKFKVDRAALMKSVLANIPLGRLLQPAEVAELVAFLCSGKADAITGQAYRIDCGFDI